jgi:two-component system, NtrC family, sensor kinase
MEEIFCIHYSMKIFINQNTDFLWWIANNYLFHKSTFSYQYCTALLNKPKFRFFQNIFRIILLLLFCLSIPGCSPSSKVPPKAVNGVLDLRDWDFEKDGIVNLDGEWEFYWGENLLGDEILAKHEVKSLIKVPGYWNGLSIKKSDGSQETISGIGYATYRLKVLHLKGTQFAVRLPGSISKIFVNRILLKEVPSSREDNDRSITYLTLPQSEGEYEFVLQIFNFENYRGGIGESLEFGKQESIDQTKSLNIGSELFVLGVIFIMGFYHISLYFLRREEKSTIYFGIICLIITMRSLTTGERYLHTLFPNISFETSFRIEYLSFNLFVPFLFEYISIIFNNNINKILKNITSYLYLFICIVILFFSPLTFLKYTDLLQIILLISILIIVYTLFKSFLNKMKGSGIFLLGISIATLFIINDILNNFYIIQTKRLGPVGLIFFIFSQSYLLSSRFSKAFQDVAELSHTLKSSNHELELTKERATRAYLELEASQKQLVQSDKMITLGTMLAGVAHEINTPLAAIKANSENILESLRGLILKLNPSLSHLTLDELQTSLKILELSRESTTPFSSREARALRKKVISLLEERNLSNVDILTDFIVELNLVEALERNEEILFSPQLERVLSLTSDLHGIRKKSTVIQTSAERVSKIVKSLKSFMHFDQNEKKVLADLTEGMETVLIILHNKIKMGIEVTKNYGEDVPQILCFPDELNQVWTNLIHNAIQAMDEKGSLQIDIEKVPSLQGTPDIDKRNPEYKGEYISVSIQDSGSGIPPEIRQKIFQAFFTTKPAGEGSGLGLHIIGKILEKHEGALYLESEPGRTRFSVLLPLGKVE